MNRILEPADAYNRELADQTHPADWTNPTPTGRYNAVVIGGGPGGLVTAMGLAGLGGKVALIERHLLGGDCLVSGCVPSKRLLAAAKVARTARKGGFGVSSTSPSVDFAKVMEGMRRVRAEISHHDAAARFQDAGVDVFLGEGTFVGPDAIEVAGTRLSFAHAVIATGARAFVPPIPGLDDVEVLTNETLFQLTALPERLVIIGGGVIGCEMAQSFAAFGSTVTVVDQAERVLARGDVDASMQIEAVLRDDGVRVETRAKVLRLEPGDAGKRVVFERDGAETVLEADAVLVAVGRRPNVEGLGLDAAGVRSGRKGIEVDDFLTTSNPKVRAIGDVASPYQFTHAADAMARMVIRNTQFFGRKRHSTMIVPTCVYTSPEVASIGITAEEAAKRPDVQVFQAHGHELDRTRIEGHDDAFVKLFADRKGNLLGASIVSERAGELVNLLSVAMHAGVGLGALSDTTFAYPTESELIRRAAGAYTKSRLTPFVARAFETWLRWRR